MQSKPALDIVDRQAVEWLADPDALPPADFARAIETLTYSNRTLYPRRSAWSTMVASGELPVLHRPRNRGATGQSP